MLYPSRKPEGRFASNKAIGWDTYIENLSPFYPLRPLQHNDRQLTHLCQKAVTSNLLGNAAHDKFMTYGTYEERNKGCHRTRKMRSRSTIHMAPEEVMNGYVPLSTELHEGNVISSRNKQIKCDEDSEINTSSQSQLFHQSE